jgi:hypothetical protein
MDADLPVDQLTPKERLSDQTANSIPISERAALTPAEFAALFGHEQSWGYRQIYAGKVRVIKGHGRMMIPKGEIERLQQMAAFW